MAAGENDTVVTTATTTKKKKKSFGVKRLFKRKKKRSDDESVFTVTEPPSIVRKESTSSTTFIAPAVAATAATTPKPIQIVLLLIDPTSRRFELLQLEFDANGAIVNDVLSQVHQSATEEIFRSMIYAGVCDLEGTEMIGLMKLVLFCRNNDVAIAIPSGLSAKDTAKLAEPILFDPKVEEMLPPRTAKIIAKQAKRMQFENGTKLSKISEVPSPSRRSNGVSSTKKTSSTFSVPTMILGVILSLIVYYAIRVHARLTRPLESGSILLRGQWKSQCGMFVLLPTQLLNSIPMERILPSCNTSTSSMLEFGLDGTLRYFTKGLDGRRKEAWSAVGGTAGEELKCSQEGDDQCLVNEAIFKEGIYNWYVVMGGTRHALSSDLERDFMALKITRER